MLHVWYFIDGRASDSLVSDNLAGEVNDYDAGRFRHHGEALEVVWLSDKASAHLRREQFGM